MYVKIECYTAAELGPNCERYCLRDKGLTRLIFGHGEELPGDVAVPGEGR